MFLGTIAGLTFGVAEQAFYTSNDIIGINQAQVANDAITGVLAFAERIFVDGFQHAVWAGIAGFFIGMALNYRRRRVQLIVLGVTVPAVLHALNDLLRRLLDLAGDHRSGGVAAALPRLHDVGGGDRATGTRDPALPRPVDDHAGHPGARRAAAALTAAPRRASGQLAEGAG